MDKEDLGEERISDITQFVDTEADPPGNQPTAHLIFGTNQPDPALIASERYHQGLAPLIIATGGVNRHNGVIEGHMFRDLLLENGVPGEAIRFEDRSSNTWQNVEFSLPFLQEAIEAGWPITAVCKWYHRRAIHALTTLAPQIRSFHAITWEPLYGGQRITRNNWAAIAEARPRVIREWEEVSRRVTDGSIRDARLVDGAWR